MIEANGLATPESYQSDLAYLKRKVWTLCLWFWVFCVFGLD